MKTMTSGPKVKIFPVTEVMFCFCIEMDWLRGVRDSSVRECALLGPQDKKGWVISWVDSGLVVGQVRSI